MKKRKTGNHLLWNLMYLPPPNLEFFKSKKRIGLSRLMSEICESRSSHQLSNRFSSSLLGRVVRKAIASEFRANKHRDVLFTEATTLSRFMDNRKHKYRSDKGFRTIAKVLILAVTSSIEGFEITVCVLCLG